MPYISGRGVVRARYTALKLGELSSVDNPAQPGALALIMKRHEGMDPAVVADVAKYVCETDGAHTFQEVLRENKFSQEIWPCVDALSQSIRSIVGDGSLTGAERETKVRNSTDQFLAAVNAIAPEVSKQLEPLLARKERDMPKSIEDLEKQVGELTGQLTSATALAQTEKARADKAEGELASEKSAHGETKKALATATEEVLKVGDVEVKKSEVGEAQFNLTKGLQNEAQMARLEKRASDEFQHVVGTATEKALVLKAIDSKPADDPTRKAMEAILTSAEKMAKLGFDSLGGRGEGDPDVKKALQTYDGKVAEIQKRDSISRSAAMSKARNEFPDEWAAAYPEEADRQGVGN
jgi:hypothetical protein